ncbi:hypothetical protein BJ742DRAFT_786710 [Cladochytrium replicatum]|nr:hypothetical protein BJ742DRAFT_786710 [Cladochytrium replicatum]
MREPIYEMNFLTQSFSSFESVKLGVNVLSREFEYVKATTRNRLSFANQLLQALFSWPDNYTANALHQAIELVCPDFPADVVERSAEIASYILSMCVPNISRTSQEPFPVAVPVPKFIECFRIYFVFMEFLGTMQKAIRDAFSNFYKTKILESKNTICNEIASYTDREVQILEAATWKTFLKSSGGQGMIQIDPPVVQDMIRISFRNGAPLLNPVHHGPSVVYFELVREMMKRNLQEI